MPLKLNSASGSITITAEDGAGNANITLPRAGVGSVSSLSDLSITATAAELNILDGATLTTAELNYVDGVTSAIQTQLDAKAPLNAPTFTGTVTGADVVAGSGRSGGVFIDGDGRNTDFNASARTASVTGEWATVRINQEAAYTGLKIFGDSSQTANYFEISDSSGTDQFKVSSTGDVDVTNELIAGSYNETYAAVTSSSNATTVDCEAGNAFSHTLTENTTFTFSNPPASGTAYSFSIEIIQDASASGFTVTFPASVDWPSATAPTLTATASAKDVFVFYTRDGGTTWLGFTAGQALG